MILYREKINTRGHEAGAFAGMIPFTDKIKNDQPEAGEINCKLFAALETGIAALREALEGSIARLHEIDEKNLARHNVKEADRRWESKAMKKERIRFEKKAS
jgi:hypothetical protein